MKKIIERQIGTSRLFVENANIFLLILMFHCIYVRVIKLVDISEQKKCFFLVSLEEMIHEVKKKSLNWFNVWVMFLSIFSALLAFGGKRKPSK